MSIKVGFSSAVCPEWDLQTVMQQAKAMGFDGVELRGCVGESDLVHDPVALRALANDAGVRLVSLYCSAAFESPAERVAHDSRRRLTEAIELAATLGCPYVSVRLGDTVGDEHRGTLSRVAARLSELAPLAARYGTTILVENGGDFTASEDLWFVIDAVSHPGVRGCWNPLMGRVRGERPTTSVPRLGRMIDVLRVADGRFDSQGRFGNHELPGAGDVELDRAIDLLKGVCFQGWLVLEWPKAAAGLPEPDVALPKALEFVRGRLADKQPILSAYKKDKHPPNFRAPPAVEAVETTSDK